MTETPLGPSGLFPGILIAYPALQTLQHPETEQLISAAYQLSRMCRSILDILSERQIPDLPPSIVENLLTRIDTLLSDLNSATERPGVAGFQDAERVLLNALQAEWGPIHRRWWGPPPSEASP